VEPADAACPDYRYVQQLIHPSSFLATVSGRRAGENPNPSNR
jgi:hypothetical protein